MNHLTTHLTTVALLGLGLGTLFAPQDPQPDPTQDPRFVRGRALFDHAFHRADGLGHPGMNADSCRACHRDPAMGGAGPLELNVSRFGRDFNGAGPFTDLAGGQIVSKLNPPFHAGREECPPEADVFEQRQTPSIFGGGLIDTIPGFVITANEDPIDADGDGIFGVARRIDVNGTIEIGRFGWKGQVPRLADFVNDAMFGEMGITTPDNGRGFGSRADGDATTDPEIDQDQVDDMAFFLANLPAPATQRGSRSSLHSVVRCSKPGAMATPNDGSSSDGSPSGDHRSASRSPGATSPSPTSNGPKSK